MAQSIGDVAFGLHGLLFLSTVPTGSAVTASAPLSGSFLSAPGTYSCAIDTKGYSAVSVDFMSTNGPSGSAIYLVQNSLTPNIPVTSATGSVLTGSVVQTISISPLVGASTCTFRLVVPVGQNLTCSVADVRAL